MLWQDVLTDHLSPDDACAVAVDVLSGNWRVYQYGDVIFLVRPMDGYGWVHLFSGGGGLLSASGAFMRDATKDFDCLAARITNPAVMNLARRFGWHQSNVTSDGHPVFFFTKEQ